MAHWQPNAIAAFCSITPNDKLQFSKRKYRTRASDSRRMALSTTRPSSRIPSYGRASTHAPAKPSAIHSAFAYVWDGRAHEVRASETVLTTRPHAVARIRQTTTIAWTSWKP